MNEHAPQMGFMMELFVNQILIQSLSGASWHVFTTLQIDLSLALVSLSLTHSAPLQLAMLPFFTSIAHDIKVFSQDS